MESAVSPDARAGPVIGQEIDGPGRQYFDDVVTDNLMDAFLELTAQVWNCHDRMLVLEQVLESQGIDASSLIEAHQPTPDQAAAIAAKREAFVNRVFASFTRERGPTQDNEETAGDG